MELDMLEELLAITAQFTDQMNSETLKIWRRISADTADLRDGTDV